MADHSSVLVLVVIALLLGCYRNNHNWFNLYLYPELCTPVNIQCNGYRIYSCQIVSYYFTHLPVLVTAWYSLESAVSQYTALHSIGFVTLLHYLHVPVTTPPANMKLLVITALCSQLFLLATCDVKIWAKNTNYDDPKNWNGGGIVCSNDKKVFPKDFVASVYVQQNESLQELVLSDNMVITFGDGVILTFNAALQDSDSQGSQSPSVTKDVDTVEFDTTTPPVTCKPKGRVVEFSAKAASWFDPGSWSTQQISTNDSSRFMLDLESVPCKEDRVVFPSKNTFLVDMERRNIQASSMLIHNEEFNSQAAFSNYWGGHLSPYEFVSRSKETPTIFGDPCGDDITCQCKDRYTPEMKAAVCKYRTCKNEKLTCRVPMLPKYGQCCQLCGARLELTVDSIASKFPFTALHNQLINALYSSKDVKYTIGPLINSTMEIILIDGGEGNSASRAVCALRDLMLKNETLHTLGLRNVEFERSDGVTSCDISPTKLPVTAPPPVKWDYIIIGVSLAIGLIGILMVILGVFLYRRKYVSGGKNEMELGQVGSTRSSQGFDNPVYDTPMPYEDSFIVTYDASEDQINGFENALYNPGTDLGATSNIEKKTPIEDPYAPVVKKSKKSGKKQKQAKNLGFDNPVYAVEDQQEGTGSMVSVPLDEDDNVPSYVEHDGTGFANPIVTGVSEEMMAPPLPKKASLTGMPSKGFANPLYSEDESAAAAAADEGDLGETTLQVQPATVTKKKKAKNGKKKKEKNGDVASKEQGFGNPMYGYEDSPTNIYQPETVGQGDTDPPSTPDADEEP